MPWPYRPMTTLLLVNPTAGHGRAGKVAPDALRAAKAAWGDVTRADTSGPGDAVALAQDAVEQGVERILVLGGDGTLHEAANGLLKGRIAPRPPIGILPAGTGNDYAKITGTYRCSPERAVERLRTGTVRQFDVGQAWGEYFINSVGIGFDAEVAREINR